MHVVSMLDMNKDNIILTVLQFVVVYKTNKFKIHLKILSFVKQINNNAIIIIIIRYGAVNI